MERSRFSSRIRNVLSSILWMTSRYLPQKTSPCPFPPLSKDWRYKVSQLENQDLYQGTIQQLCWSEFLTFWAGWLSGPSACCCWLSEACSGWVASLGLFLLLLEVLLSSAVWFPAIVSVNHKGSALSYLHITTVLEFKHTSLCWQPVLTCLRLFGILHHLLLSTVTVISHYENLVGVTYFLFAALHIQI